MGKIILTGDRPTGPLHIGHYIGSLKNRVELQNNNDIDKMYVMIADSQALTDNFDNPKKIQDNLHEVILDYLSVGLNPEDPFKGQFSTTRKSSQIILCAVGISTFTNIESLKSPN